MAGFDYKYTCPDIDSCANRIKDALLDLLEEYADEEQHHRHILISAVSYFYRNELEDMIEEVRNTNSDMRKAAERQIDSLENDISELESTVNELRSEIVNLEDCLNNQ